ncbi:MAG: RNA polymerase-binding protein DksA [Epsilonproteobacteria bacterium]|nr:RNA polymerase-binding protein DksA [Campylobacterota bacterium]
MLSEKELEFFEKMLIEQRDKIVANMEKAYTEIVLMNNQDPKDEGDFALLASETAIDDRLISKQREELKEIEEALDKIRNKTYGICEMCEEPIGIDRLKVKPYARYCITCREINEKEKKIQK